MKKILLFFALTQGLNANAQCPENRYMLVTLTEAIQLINSSPCYHPAKIVCSIAGQNITSANSQGGNGGSQVPVIVPLIPLHSFYDATKYKHLYSVSPNAQDIPGDWHFVENNIMGNVGQNVPSLTPMIRIYRFHNPTIDDYFFSDDINGEGIIQKGYSLEKYTFDAWPANISYSNINPVNLIRLYIPYTRVFTVWTSDENKFWYDLIGPDQYHSHGRETRPVPPSSTPVTTLPGGGTSSCQDCQTISVSNNAAVDSYLYYAYPYQTNCPDWTFVQKIPAFAQSVPVQVPKNTTLYLNGFSQPSVCTQLYFMGGGLFNTGSAGSLILSTTPTNF